MTKLISLAVLGCCGLLTCADQVQACGGQCCAGAPVVASAPAPTTTASAQGYRTYSYQPGSYAPRAMSRSYRPGNFHGHSAGWKVTGDR